MKKIYFALVTAAALGASLVYAQNGESLYGQCAACHGTQGGGGQRSCAGRGPKSRKSPLRDQSDFARRRRNARL